MRRNLFSTIIISLFSLCAYAQPQGWQYSLPITITNSNTTLINYAMPIVINTQALISGGQMQAAGNDIRFGTPCTGGAKSYNYFIDSGLNTTSTLIYVLLDTLLANQSITIYMFYGNPNPNLSPVSNIAILNGPKTLNNNQGTNGFSSSFYMNYVLGSTFIPNKDLFVMSLGKRTVSSGTYSVKLWDATGNLLAQTSVNSSAHVYGYANLSTPIQLKAGNQYTVSVFVGGVSPYGYDYISGTTLSNDVTFIQTSYTTTGNNFPNFNFSSFSVYGLGDLKYYYANPVANPPTYYIGTPNSGGITGQPSNLTICAGNLGSFSAFSPAFNQTHHWQKKQGANWLNLSNTSPYSGVYSSVLTISAATIAMNGSLYRDSMSNSCGIGVSNAATLSVIQTPPIIPVASISGPNPACANNNALYTINTNVNGGSYQWMLNNTLVSTNQSYAFQPNNNDHLYAIVSSPNNGNLGCYSLPTAVSNQIIIATGNNFMPNATVVANETNVCDGTQINFNLQSNVYGGSYHWFVNGNPVGLNNPGYTYVPANGDQVSCTVITPSNGCYNLPYITSLPLAISTVPNITPVVNLSAPPSAPASSHVMVSLTILNLSASYYILWYKNGVKFDSTLTPTTSFTKGNGIDYITAKLYPYSDASIGACFANVTSNQVSVSNSTASVNIVNGESVVSVYPNPFKNEMVVNGLQGGDKVCLYDITGRMMSQVWNIENSDEQKLNTSDIMPGLYFMRVTNSNGNVRSVIRLQKL